MIPECSFAPSIQAGLELFRKPWSSLFIQGVAREIQFLGQAVPLGGGFAGSTKISPT